MSDRRTFENRVRALEFLETVARANFSVNITAGITTPRQDFDPRIRIEVWPAGEREGPSWAAIQNTLHETVEDIRDQLAEAGLMEAQS